MIIPIITYSKPKLVSYMAVDHWCPCGWYSSTLVSPFCLQAALYCDQKTGAAQSILHQLANRRQIAQRFTLSWTNIIPLMEVTPSHLFHQPWKLAVVEEMTEKSYLKKNTASNLKPTWLFCLFNSSSPSLRARTNFSFIPSWLLKISLGSFGGSRKGAVTQPVRMALHNF